MLVSAVIPVFHEHAFLWLAGDSVLTRLLKKLEDVRGIDELQILTTQDLRERVLEELVNRNSEMCLPFTLSTAFDGLTTRRPLMATCMRAGAGHPKHIAVGVNPMYPFLPAGAIEEILGFVQNDDTAIAYTTHGEYNLQEGLHDKYFVRSSPPVDACLAAHINDGYSPSDKSEKGERPNWIKRELTVIEAINIESDHGWHLACDFSTNNTF